MVRDDEFWQVIHSARAGLSRGDKRDDVYHEVVRFSAMNGYDRYILWQLVVQGAQ